MNIVTPSGKLLQFSDSYVTMLKNRTNNGLPLTEDEAADYKIIINAEQSLNSKRSKK